MQLINHQSQLEDICRQLVNCPILSIDTEFSRRRTYFADLSIVQIMTKQHQVIIDILAGLDLTPLKNILADRQIIKIFHAPQQDFEIFHHLFHQLPQNIFDTQIAANICGLGKSLSYSDLCQNICQVTIDKTYQKANWLKRPISQNMLNYAIIDVQYLEPLYWHFQALIKAENHLEAYQHKIDLLLNNDHYLANFQDAWQKIKLSGHSKSFVDRMQILAAFREEYARHSNLPRRHFITDEDLIKICHHLPGDAGSLRALKLNSYRINELKYQNKLFELCLGLNECRASPVIAEHSSRRASRTSLRDIINN